MLREALIEVDWYYKFFALPVEKCFCFFQNKILSLLERYVPVRVGKPSEPWSCRPPGWLLQRKSNAWSTYKHARREFGRREAETNVALSVFLDLNSGCRNYSLNSRCQYEAWNSLKHIPSCSIFISK